METVHSLVCVILIAEVFMIHVPYYSLCSVDLESLGPLLGQIVVALYPVIDEQPHKVADIFHFLIVQNRFLVYLNYY